MPLHSISSTSMSALRHSRDELFVADIVAWAKQQIAWALDSRDDPELTRRARLTVRFGQRYGVEDENDLALLFGALHVAGPGLAREEAFQHSLGHLGAEERRQLLFDVLSGVVAFSQRYGGSNWTLTLG